MTLGNAGVQGSMAGTSLRQAINQMLRPSEDAIATMQKLGLQFLDLTGTQEELRDAISEGEKQELREQAKQEIQQSLQASVKDTWNRLHEVVKHCAEKLGDDKAIFRNTLIGNVEALVEVIPGLNFTEDPELERLRKACEETLCGLDPDALRKSKRQRAEAAQAAKGLVGQIEAASADGNVEQVAKVQRVATMAKKFDAFL
jgi:hypothetical protein